MATPRYICIHGHFYQPPRENPWLEAVEVQDSAHPYHDWNERITRERDKRTQVLWGVADFRHRFGREPEGMWLPETAADTDTLEALAAAGIKFTVLAPRQARRWRRVGEAEWTEIPGGIDPSRAYLQR